MLRDSVVWPDAARGKTGVAYGDHFIDGATMWMLLRSWRITWKMPRMGRAFFGNELGQRRTSCGVHLAPHVDRIFTTRCASKALEPRKLPMSAALGCACGVRGANRRSSASCESEAGMVVVAGSLFLAGAVYDLLGRVWHGASLWGLGVGQSALVEAERLHYSDGNLRIEQGQLLESDYSIRFARGEIDAESGQMELHDVEMKTANGWFLRAAVLRKGDDGLALLHDATLTACDCDCPVWSLTAESLEVINADSARLRGGRFSVLGRLALPVPDVRPSEAAASGGGLAAFALGHGRLSYRAATLCSPQASGRVRDSSGVVARAPAGWSVARGFRDHGFVDRGMVRLFCCLGASGAFLFGRRLGYSARRVCDCSRASESPGFLTGNGPFGAASRFSTALLCYPGLAAQTQGPLFMPFG